MVNETTSGFENPHTRSLHCDPPFQYKSPTKHTETFHRLVFPMDYKNPTVAVLLQPHTTMLHISLQLFPFPLFTGQPCTHR